MNIDEALKIVVESVCNKKETVPLKIALILHDNIQNLRLCLEAKKKDKLKKCNICWTCNFSEGCNGYYYRNKEDKGGLNE